MKWIIRILRIIVLLILLGGLYWIWSIAHNLGPQIFYYTPDLQYLLTMAVILVLMPALVLYCSSNTFITKWWNNKGRLILLILCILTALGYLVSLFWALIVAAS